MTTVLHKKKGSDDFRRLQERSAFIWGSFGVKRIGIFGSVARGEETDASDIDILVEFAQDHATFRNFMDLIQYLEDLFGRKVDLVTTGGIDPYLRPYIEGEVIWCEGIFLHHIMDEMVFLEEQCSSIMYDDLIHDEVLKRSVLRSLEVK